MTQSNKRTQDIPQASPVISECQRVIDTKLKELK